MHIFLFFLIAATVQEEKLRQKMKSYWQVYSPSLESMMLSNDAKYLAENEQNEVMSYLPPYQGKRVLELGAGIGYVQCRTSTFLLSNIVKDFHLLCVNRCNFTITGHQQAIHGTPGNSGRSRNSCGLHARIHR